MSNWRLFVAIIFVIVQPLPASPQPTKTADSLSTAKGQSNSRESTPASQSQHPSIPSGFYDKWRKYGQWDYKQQGFRYRDFTQFNFGATGTAAGFDQKSLIALVQSAKPTREDIRALDYPELQGNFKRDAEELERLRTMVAQDAHLMRIAPDFTLLDTDNKWPRDNIGLSEARWNEYRSAFKKLSLSEGIVRTEDFPGAIFFITRTKGLCIGGSRRWVRLFERTTRSDHEIAAGRARCRGPQESYQALRVRIYAIASELVCLLSDRLVTSAVFSSFITVDKSRFHLNPHHGGTDRRRKLALTPVYSSRPNVVRVAPSLC